MGSGYPTGWLAYAGVDGILRLLAGEKEVGNSGAGLQVFDAEHNLPPKGEPFRPTFDYKQAYREAWGL
jgi:ribose transport system substrate-binding protein